MQLDIMQENQASKGKGKEIGERPNSYVMDQEMGDEAGGFYTCRSAMAQYDVDKQTYQGQWESRGQSTQFTMEEPLQITQGPSHDHVGNRGRERLGPLTASKMVDLDTIQKGDTRKPVRMSSIGQAIAMELQQWNYIVEPPDSPATSGDGPTMPTGLSPLIQRINQKRKQTEDPETEEDEGEDKMQISLKGGRGKAREGRVP